MSARAAPASRRPAPDAGTRAPLRGEPPLPVAARRARSGRSACSGVRLALPELDEEPVRVLRVDPGDVRAEILRFRWQLAELEAEGLHAQAYVSRFRSSTKSPCVSCGWTQATSARRPSTRTPASFRRSTLPGMSWHSKPTR